MPLIVLDKVNKLGPRKEVGRASRTGSQGLNDLSLKPSAAKWHEAHHNLSEPHIPSCPGKPQTLGAGGPQGAPRMQPCPFDLMGWRRGAVPPLSPLWFSPLVPGPNPSGKRGEAKVSRQPTLSLQESCGQLGCIYPTSSPPLGSASSSAAAHMCCWIREWGEGASSLTAGLWYQQGQVLPHGLT